MSEGREREVENSGATAMSDGIKRRKTGFTTNIIAGGGDESEEVCVLFYDSPKHFWCILEMNAKSGMHLREKNELSKMPSRGNGKLNMFSCAALESTIYLFGGYYGSGDYCYLFPPPPTNDVYRFGPNDCEWVSCPKMQQARRNPKVIAVAKERRFYVFGTDLPDTQPQPQPDSDSESESESESKSKSKSESESDSKEMLGEYYDLEADSWFPVECILPPLLPEITMSLDIILQSGHTVLDDWNGKGSAIIFWNTRLFFLLQVSTGEWTGYLFRGPLLPPFFDTLPCYCTDVAVVRNVLFRYCGSSIYAFNADFKVDTESSYDPILSFKGFRRLPFHPSYRSFKSLFMIDTRNGLCLILYDQRHRTLDCTEFQFKEQGQGQTMCLQRRHSFPIGFTSCPLILDCFPMVKHNFHIEKSQMSVVGSEHREEVSKTGYKNSEQLLKNLSRSFYKTLKRERSEFFSFILDNSQVKDEKRMKNFLQILGLKELLPMFQEEEIDISALTLMDDDDLNTLPIRKIDIPRILYARDWFVGKWA